MKYILIDTCSFLNLIDKKKVNPQIEKLDFWIKEQLIEIIVPDLISSEWHEHKEKEKQRITTEWNTKQTHFTEIAKLSGNLPMINYNFELEFIDKQIDTIDKIIQNSPNKVSVSNEVKLIISDKQLKPKKAPFHHKDDSIKDAYIYFSTLEFCNAQGIEELYFFSDNSSDFGKALPNKKGSKSEIHPDLLTDYPSVDVKYFGIIGQAIDDLSNELPSPSSNDVHIDMNISENIYIEKEKPLLEQMQDYISIVHKELSFTPIHIFIRNYPFKLNANFNPHYNLFTLTTDNERLFSFFENIEITNGVEINLVNKQHEAGVPDAVEKIKEVLKYLNQNLIFNIASSKSHKKVDIRLREEKKCDCLKCCLKKLRFTDFFNKFNSYEITLDNLREQSYLLYKLGNYIKASEYIRRVYELAINEKSYSLAFIAQYNLSKLSIFIRNSYWGENQRDDLVKELSSINLSEISKQYETQQNIQIIKWIRENDFLTKTRDKILSSVTKIQDSYYSHLHGGLSSNNEVWNLINTYSELDSFLNRNYIIYDEFEEFEELSSTFFEGIFASHAISESNGSSRLNYFDDWIMSKLVLYGNAERMNEFVSRYKIKKVVYKKNSSQGYSFTELVDNFFSNTNLRELFHENCETNNRRFWDYYNNIFRNILTLVSISNFDDKTFINTFSRQLIEYLENENFVNTNSYKHINIFLYHCGKEIDTEFIHRFFDLGITNSSFYDSEFYDALLRIFEDRRIKITINEDQFETIKSTTAKDTNSSLIIISLYLMIENIEYKTEIKKTIKSNLEEEFSFKLFYLATLFELIPLDYDMLNKAIELSITESNLTSFKSFVTGLDDKRFDKVNSILNLCFKFNIDITIEQQQHYQTLDPYYSWLLDMDNFNYDSFDPKWIGEYPTRFYFKKIYSSKIVKEQLDNIIKDNFENNLERDYLNIYVRKTWNMEK